MKKPGTASLLLSLALTAPAALTAVSIPYSFSNGNVADATEVNANFAAIGAALEAFETDASGITRFSGGVRPGPAGDADCTGERLGTLRWVATSERLEVCRSSGWARLREIPRYRYWRLVITGVQGGGNQVQITEAHFRSAAGRLLGTPVNSGQSTGTATQTNNNSFANEDQHNLDGVSTGVTIRYDYGSPIEVVALSLGQSDSSARFPDDFRVEGSTDGATWQVVANVVNWAPGNSIGEKVFTW